MTGPGVKKTTKGGHLGGVTVSKSNKITKQIIKQTHKHRNKEKGGLLGTLAGGLMDHKFFSSIAGGKQAVAVSNRDQP